MSKHDEKPIKISVTIPCKYIERLLITVLLFSHLVSFYAGSLGLSTPKAMPSECEIHPRHAIKTKYLSSA